MKTQVSNHWELSSSHQCRKFFILIVPMEGDEPHPLGPSGFLTDSGSLLLADFKKTSRGHWNLENVHQTVTQFDWNLITAGQTDAASFEPKGTAELFEGLSLFIGKAQAQTEACKFLFADLQNFPFSQNTQDSQLNPVLLGLHNTERNCVEVCTLIANLKMKLQHVNDCGFLVLLKFANTQDLWPTLLVTGQLEMHPLFSTAELLNAGIARELNKIPELMSACRRVSEGSAGFHLPSLDELGSAVQRLARVISCLRGPNGCPWDIDQNTASLVPFLIEEAYEAAEAADLWVSGEDPSGTKFADELGDVLLQIVLNAQIAAEQKVFDLRTVIDGLAEKMIRRHPHVFETENSKSQFTSTEVKDAQGVKQLWEEVKAKETQSSAPQEHDLLHKAAKKKSLPTLEYVSEISKRASKLGFCWQTIADVWRDVESEVLELKSEIFVNERNWKKVEDELGDVVFALANVLVHMKQKMNGPEELNFDTAARKSAAKFITRFKEMERIYLENTSAVLSESVAKTLDLDTWNELWSHAKKRRYR